MNTEESGHHTNLENYNTTELLNGINELDKTVPLAVEAAIPQISKVVDLVANALQNGGRLFYLGSGTSGRLGIVDASECPPTYGVSNQLVQAIISGGDTAIRSAVEFAEDDTEAGFNTLLTLNISKNDVVFGISASGKTPFVLGALQACAKNQIPTACLVCNSNSIIAQNTSFPIEVITGPEFVRGSTRMKAGTATKLVLNMVTTAAMIKLGKIKGNMMVDMQLSNHKLVERGINMIMEKSSLTYKEAKDALLKYGSVRAALNNL